MTHKELVERAKAWLKGRRRCCFVVTEPQGHAFREWPDAIGWTYRGFSVLVECKASLSDFYADRRKRNRAIFGMGDQRFYMTRPGLIVPERHTLPDNWGLVEVHKHMVKVVVKAPLRMHSCFKREEQALLVQQCRTDFPIAEKRKA